MNNEITESIIGFDALYESMLRCKCNVSWKNSTASFYLNSFHSVLKLESELKNGTYVPRPPREFMITYPKKREAVSIAFRDRVYQRSLNDNQIYPQISRKLIYDNCACQKGKGTDFARNRLKCHLQKFYRKYGTKGYALRCDIRHYYPSMSHNYTSEVFRRMLDETTYEMAKKVLNDQYSGDVGYSPGSQMIQIAGITLLNGLDHFIKEKLHVRFYIRYMDDFILIHYNKQFLIECLEKIRCELSKNGFELHTKKTMLEPIAKPIDFLGFKFKLTDTGKVVLNIKPDVVKRERRRLRRMIKKAKKGGMTKDKVDECYLTWKNHVSKGSTYKAISKMDKYYQNLWRNKNENI